MAAKVNDYWQQLYHTDMTRFNWKINVPTVNLPLMHNPPDILALAYKQAPLQEQLTLLQEKQQSVPGTVQYHIKRFRRNAQWNMEDTGMLVYHYEKNKVQDSYLELKFCVSGNMYCRHKNTECNRCKVSASKDCAEKEESVD
ncbi:MAG: hypothetical protein EOO09_22770, partial [Chitinophagaceae bacterium]